MSEKKRILITGGSGLIGTRLTTMLLDKGYYVAHLSRNRTGNEKNKTYQWEPAAGKIEMDAFSDIDYIVHLAGENIASHRWTKDFKKKIIDSRINTFGVKEPTLQKVGSAGSGQILLQMPGVEDPERVFLRLLGDRVERAVEDALGEALAATEQHGVHEFGDQPVGISMATAHAPGRSTR